MYTKLDCKIPKPYVEGEGTLIFSVIFTSNSLPDSPINAFFAADTAVNNINYVQQM